MILLLPWLFCSLHFHGFQYELLANFYYNCPSILSKFLNVFMISTVSGISIKMRSSDTWRTVYMVILFSIAVYFRYIANNYNNNRLICTSPDKCVTLLTRYGHVSKHTQSGLGFYSHLCIEWRQSFLNFHCLDVQDEVIPSIHYIT